MQSYRLPLIIVGSSCLFHLAILVLLLFFYQSYCPQPLLPSTSSPETFFYQEPLLPADPPSTSVWAELKPQASTLAATMQELEQEETGDPQASLGVSPEESTQPSIIAEQVSCDRTQDSSQDISLPEVTPGQLSKALCPTSSTVSGQLTRVSPKAQARQLLAGITKGYIQQLTQEGNNHIKTIGGDPNKLPTDEQLKYERYMVKIIWCLQNAHTILCTSYQPSQDLDTHMRIHCAITKQGTMEEFRILESAGIPELDAYIAKVFAYASSSFPPLPDYITAPRLPVSLIINFKGTKASPYQVGLAHY